MSKIEVNEIDKTTGSTLTIGGSGTTVQLGTGASQTGFGATGGISWQTAIKTADFTAASGEGYFVNTSGGSDITVTLPASPSAGNVVAIKDYARTFGTNKVTLARNGSNMDGVAANTDLVANGTSATLVFMDSTKGWSLINDDETSRIGAKFIAASGGTVTTVCTNFKVHTFTGPGTFTVSCAGNAGGSNTVSYMVIAGGGGSGGSEGGGGGGAGGYREGLGLNDSYSGSPLRASTGVPVTATGFPITVGAGGAGSPGPGCNEGSQGASSVFSTITSAGGGFGNQHSMPAPGGDGGSGGGGGARQGQTGGSGNTPPVSPPQGNNGGSSAPGSSPSGVDAGGGGGGAGGAGQNAANCTSGDGGAAITTSINGTPTARAGGGGGGNEGNHQSTATGGGGAGGFQSTAGVAGTANTGGGGGGSGTNTPGAGHAGGSGLVIIRYKFQ